jgi:DNA-binding response OmpR family regulator
MSGQVSLESKPGEGTAFLITLPLQVVQKNGTQASQGKSVNNVVPNPSSDIQPIEPDILIVEDNTEVQSLLVDIFQHQYSLRVMDDGQMALSYLQSATKLPSLIITDLMMPKLDGISFIKILKADHRYALLPILVLSAVNTPLTKINALTIGVDDYINKPFRIEELRAIATTILKNAAARLEATKEASDLLPTENATGDHNINQYEKEWLEKTEAILWDMVKKGKDVKVKDFANTLHISERQLQRQIKQFVGLTPVEYINEIRLQRARQLIDNKTYSTVAEVAYEVGYAYPNYFSRIFTKRFGQPPSHFFKS